MEQILNLHGKSYFSEFLATIVMIMLNFDIKSCLSLENLSIKVCIVIVGSAKPKSTMAGFHTMSTLKFELLRSSHLDKLQKKQNTSLQFYVTIINRKVSKGVKSSISCTSISLQMFSISNNVNRGCKEYGAWILDFFINEDQPHLSQPVTFFL